jgi:hypothetical protein
MDVNHGGHGGQEEKPCLRIAPPRPPWYVPGRREFLQIVGSAAAALMPRAGLPATQRPGPHRSSRDLFTDITAAAGLLQARNVSGSPDDKQFLLEEMGCGAAFFDYDNDGWLDIFL